MTKEITDKRYVMALKGNVRIWLNEEEFETAKKAVASDASFLEVGDKFISKYAILYIVPASEIEEAEKIKKGEWKCAYGFWHETRQECGHGLL